MSKPTKNQGIKKPPIAKTIYKGGAELIKKNLGTIDRIIRLAIALVFLYLAAVIVRGYWAIFLAAFAGFAIHAAIDGY